jgi:hypothetical protein
MLDMLSEINDSFGDIVTARVSAGQWMVLTVAVRGSLGREWNSNINSTLLPPQRGPTIGIYCKGKQDKMNVK